MKPLRSINNDISIHQKHLRYLDVEVYETVIEINPEFMEICFMTNPISYDLRKGDEVFLNPARSVRYRINLLLF